MSGEPAEEIDIAPLMRLYKQQDTAQYAVQVVMAISVIVIILWLGGRSAIAVIITHTALSILMLRGNRQAAHLLFGIALVLIVAGLFLMANSAFFWEKSDLISEADFQSSRDLEKKIFYVLAVSGLTASYFIVRGWRASIMRTRLVPQQSVNISAAIKLWLSVLRRLLLHWKAWILLALATLITVLIAPDTILMLVDLIIYDKPHFSNKIDGIVYMRLFDRVDVPPWVLIPIMAIFLVSLLGLLVWIWNLLRQSIAETTEEAQQRDTRAPVLLLRSFADDALTVHPSQGMNLSQKANTLENTLERELRSLGPVIAIGQPGERLPRLGAAREYLTGESWRGRVRELIGEAQAVVVLMGAGEGLCYEYDLLSEHGALEKLLLVIPPDTSEQELQLRWNRFAHYALKTDNLTTPDLQSTIIALFREKRPPTYVVHCPRRASANQYTLALQMALHCSCFSLDYSVRRA